MTTDFSSLSLRPELHEVLGELGFTTPTPIQAQALPPALAGRDLVGQARTGSGKTVAFGLALLQGLDTTERGARALVLTPTRELAEQVADELRRLARRIDNTRVATICGGARIGPQLHALEQGAQVVVGTPGRLLDHLRRGSLWLDDLQVVVLDEADRMLDMGFVDEVREVLSAAPAARQTLLFSATFPDGIRALSHDLQRDPLHLTVGEEAPPEAIAQQVLHCEADDRHALVVSLLAHHAPSAALLFCETREDCEALARTLAEAGAPSLVLHGGLEQRDRDDAWLQFSNGSARLLVATDVAARGLDLPGLPLVIVTELSPDPVAHLHRVGRTGRAGVEGLALTIVAGPAEARRLERLEAHIGEALPIADPPPSATSLADLTPTWQTLLLLSGKKDKLRKGDVLGALVKDVGLSPDEVGQIGLSAHRCAVAIARGRAREAHRHFQRGRIKNRRVRTVLL